MLKSFRVPIKKVFKGSIRVKESLKGSMRMQAGVGV